MAVEIRGVVMVFEDILAPLMEAQYGLQCVVLADTEGEMVAQAEIESAAADSAALFGAHQGVILMHVTAAGVDACSGDVEELHIRCEHEDWFVFPVTTEYYLALAGYHGVQIGRARLKIRQCVRQLEIEINA
ncbi:MAG: hypothetical protein ABR516_01945 [Desulfuromonadaceae bacterium]|nr:hypothetical protein [Geobacteraceae bacterium]